MASPGKNIITAIGASMDIVLRDDLSLDELKKMLAEHVNLLIGNNFNKLISILYRMDINELRLRQLLNESTSQDAGTIIADLIIERQLQKIKSREMSPKKGENNINENEKW